MKNFKLFEKLWEHSRTLKRVGLVLVMCLIAIPQVWADMYLIGSFNGWNADEKDGKWDTKWKFDGTGELKVHLDAGNYHFRIKDGYTDRYWQTSAITGSISKYTLGNEGTAGTCYMETTQSGLYIFKYVYEDSKHKLSISFPKDRVPKGTILYFSAWNSNTNRWRDAAFHAKYVYKYYDSGSNLSSGAEQWCESPVTGDQWVFYTTVPNNDYVGKIQVCRIKPSDHSTQWGYTNDAVASSRTDERQNCMYIKSENADWTSTMVPGWSYYCPPTTSETFADNSTSKISWQDEGNDGSTSGKAILVKTGTTLKVTASASKAVADANMTVKYDFQVNSGSVTSQTSGSYTATASTNNTEYNVKMQAYTNYNLKTDENSAKSTTKNLYYKALDTYTVTNSLANITSDGRSGSDAAAYNIAYTATLSASSGYNLPAAIMVKRGETDITANCTWDHESGALTIPAAQVTGNITITASGVSCPTGGSVYKFEVNNTVSDGYVCAVKDQVYPQNSALSTLTGGTLDAICPSTNYSYLQYKSHAYYFTSGASPYLVVHMDCELQAGDKIGFVNSASSSNVAKVRKTSASTTTDEISLVGNSASTVQWVEIPASFVGEHILYIIRGNNSPSLKSFEIFRPYTITLDANGGTVNSKSSDEVVADGYTYFPLAEKSGCRFKGGWYTESSGGDMVTEPYFSPDGATLYAQFDECATPGTVFSFQLKTGLTNASASTTGSYFNVNKSNYLATMYGGTVQGYADNADYFKIVNNNAIRFGDNTKGRLKINLDCAIQAGDTIKSSTSGSSGAKMIIAVGETDDAVQTLEQGANAKAVVVSDLVDKSTIYIRRKESKDVQITAFEIIRPAHYTITHDLSHVTTSSPEEVIHKAGYTATYTADDGYELPDAVTVMRGVTNITASCTWVQGTGTLTIPAADCIGDITISITGDVAAPTYGITNGDPSNGSISIQISSSDVTEGEEGDQVDIVATPNTGYSFSAWNIYKTDASGTKVTPAASTASTSFTMPAYAVTVDASFTINSWDLSWNFDGGETSSESYTTAGTKNYGTAITYPANNTMSKTGHTFTGWSSSATTMPDNDLEIIALWSANTYNVASHTLSNATLSSGGATGTGKATYGTNYTATFAANTGYNLPSDVTVQIGGVTKTKDTHYTWNSTTGELSINGSYILGNIAISVTAVAKTYTLTLDKNGGNADGEAVAIYNSHTLASITDATCTNLTHYSLDGYYTAADGGTEIITQIQTIVPEEISGWTSAAYNYYWIHDAEETLYAHWGTTIFLNPNRDHHGTGSESSAASGIYNGSSLKGFATAMSDISCESGYSLQGFYTSAVGGTKVLNADGSFADDDITDYVDDGKWIYNSSSYARLYAHWAKECTVTYDGNSEDDGNAPDAVDALYGTTITVASNSGSLTKTDYTFVGWNTSSAGTGTFYAVGSTFTITGDITLYAQWSTASGDCETLMYVWDTTNSDCDDNSTTEGATFPENASNTYFEVDGTGVTEKATNKGSLNLNKTKDNNILLTAKTGYVFKSIVFKGKIEDLSVDYTTNNSTWSTLSSTNTSGDDCYEFNNINSSYYGIKLTAESPNGIWIRNMVIEMCPTGGTTYTVSFANMTGFEGPTTLPSTIEDVLSGSKIAEPVIPSATGYVFGGWYKEGACSNKWDFSTDVVDDDITLYAKWINVSGKYTFHYGDGQPSDNTWVIKTFTEAGSGYHKIEDFEIPDADKYPSFFVGYEGAYDTETAHSQIYTWDAATGLGNGHMPIRHWGTRYGSQSELPIAGNGNTAEGAKGTLRISTSGSTNCYVGFYPNGYGLTWNRETTALHATPSPEVFETDVVTLTAAEAAGNFEVKLATEDSYVAYSRTATETAEGQLNDRKVAGETYDIAAGTVGRFQINLSKKEDNYGLRFVPLVNRTSTSGNWETDNNWTLWRRPNIEETAYVAHFTTIKTPTAQAKNVIVDKTSGVGYPKVSIASGADGVGGLLVENHIQVLKMVDDEPTLSDETTYSELEINSSDYGSGALIMGDASTTTAAYTELYTKAIRDGFGWVNQYVGTPSANGSIYDFYGSYLYVFSPTTGGWVQANRQPSSAMPTFKAYNLMRNEPFAGTYSFYDPLVFPGITGDDKLKVLSCDDEDEKTSAEDNRIGAYMFANSWTAPIDVKAMEESDFDGSEATIYIFNAGSPYQAEAAEGPSSSAVDPGQWVSIPVEAAPYLPENLTVIPSMQAFRINTTAANASLTLDYEKHVYEPAKNRAAGIEIKPLRAPKHNDARPNIMKFFVEAASGYRDNLYLFEREDFMETFDNGWDGRKVFGVSNAPQIYGINGDLKTAINAISDLEGQQVGFKTGTADSEYTITFNYEGDDTWYFNDTKEQEATLISNDAEYTFTTESDENTARFYISATPIQKVATGVENVQGNDVETNKVHKVLINDHIYIILDGEMYDATGKKIK